MDTENTYSSLATFNYHDLKIHKPVKGLYFVFEGCDGVGKTSTMAAVHNRLKQVWPENCLISTHHPGSTPLGAHLRKLVKTPAEIDTNILIDDLSRQTLYMVDTISFINTLLKPSIEAGTTVLADRSSFISAMVYGLADGLNQSDILKLFNLIETPRATRLYVLSCPWEQGYDRLKLPTVREERNTVDHYDKKGIEFFKKIKDLYDSLASDDSLYATISKLVDRDNIVYVDSSQAFDDVVEKIVIDILTCTYGNIINTCQEKMIENIANPS